MIFGPINFAFTYGLRVTIIHSSSIPARNADLFAVCIVPNNGYILGDKIGVSPFAHSYENGVAPNEWGFMFHYNFSPTTSELMIGQSPMYGLIKVTASLFQILDTQWNLELILFGY